MSILMQRGQYDAIEKEKYTNIIYWTQISKVNYIHCK